MISRNVLIPRRKAVWGPKRILAAVALLVVAMVPNAALAKSHSQQAAHKVPGLPGATAKSYKLDGELSRRSQDKNGSNVTRVIVTLVPGATLPPEFKKYARNAKLDLINGQVLDLPNGVLKAMANHPSVFRVHFDRPIKSHNYRTAVTVGARTVQESLGYTGAGIGVAIIDSGISAWHDDLTNTTAKLFPYGNQRVAHTLCAHVDEAQLMYTVKSQCEFGELGVLSR